jgi:hypothetical protein
MYFLLRVSLGIVLSIGCLSSAARADALEDDFHHPPPGASTWVYWVWLQTPTTPAAITRDLEEMKAKGIAGFILYDTGAGNFLAKGKMIPVDKGFKQVATHEYDGQYIRPLPPLAAWSPEWRKDVRYVAAEAKRLGLTFCLAHGLAGVSAPGLDPRYGQQELKWSQQDVEGPGNFDATLSLPPLLAPKTREPKRLSVFWDVAALAVPIQDHVQLTDVRTLSAQMDASGRLRWRIPQGKWRIFRFIQRPTGASNVWGLFCDTLSPEGIDHAWALTMAPLLEEMTPEERAGLTAVEDDSWESGQPSWSTDFPQEFQKRRGYDLMPYLPALAGVTMVDATTTERIKEDFKQTISDLIVTNYYAHMHSICQQNNLILYDETDGPNIQWADFSMTGANVDHAMAEFWMPSVHRPIPANRFLSREAATSNHIYGRKLTMCEAFTSLGPMWEETPFSLKACVDQAYCDGVNRTCIHNYGHSPLLNAKPGEVYCAGTQINRNITWWDEFPAFGSYLARCDAMLQDGNFVADALFDTGDGIGQSQPTKVLIRGLGAGYDYDRASNVALINVASVKDNRIVTTGGMSYRVLIMPQHQNMTLAALTKIAALVQSGATIVGPRPTGLAGMPVHPDDERQFNVLVTQLWGGLTGYPSDKKLGAGRVVSDKTADQVLQAQGVGPDFEFDGLSPHGEVAWIHRNNADEDWYYVTSRWFSPEKVTCKFRITGKQPELWDPVTGETRDATAFRQENGQTIVPVEFDPCGSVFVVFRRPIAPTAGGTTAGNYPIMQPLGDLDGPWTVAFDGKWGGPAEPMTFDRLVDWTTRPEFGIKYYSGTGVYTRKFDLPSAVPPGRRLILDLGEVHEVASVKLNGQNLGVLWAHPARVDITSVVKPAGNDLEIKVVNLWPNRLIGDSTLPREQQLTITNIHHFTKTSQLLPSGLLGPVKVLAAQPPAVE